MFYRAAQCYIDGQDVILLGDYIRTGRYPVQRIMTVGGSLAPAAGHVSTRAGVPLSLLCSGGPAGGQAARTIVGGVFTGYAGRQVGAQEGTGITNVLDSDISSQWSVR